MDKLLLVDGSNLLFQMFFGMPARIFNRNKKAVHGTIGFVGALLKIMRFVKPTHVAVLFDGEHENARAALDCDYKANRPDYSCVTEAENPFSQLSDIYDALDFLHLKHAETRDCETDDWIAGYALGYGKDADVVISSFDSDYFQLLSDKVSVLRYRGIKTSIVTPRFLGEKFGILPSQYADFKALVGDSSDNVKGAEKIGAKTAARLLTQFSSLDEILQNADSIAPPSVRASVLKSAEKLRTNYEIIKLKGDAPLPFPLGELIYRDGSLTSTEVLRGTGLLP